MIHVRMAKAPEHMKLWEALIGSRKNAVRQASLVGWDTAFQLLTRSIALDDLVEKACRRIGVKGRVPIWAHAEPCMDVDKPHQLELLRTDLAKQQRKSVGRAKSAAKKPARKSAKSESAVRAVKKGSRPAKKASTGSAKTKVKARK
jgi:hypothetical protein